MKLNKKGYEFIVKWEGKHNKAYYDSINLLTIGIGFIQVNNIKVKIGDTMTDEQIEKEFSKQIISYENCVNSNVKSVLTQSQFDTLCSFTFNLGCSAFKSSTLLKKINIG